jgi:hypothetical protein
MAREVNERGGPAAGTSRLPARTFYGVIVAGVVLGVCLCGSAAWAYLQAGDRDPTSRRIWGDVARDFVVPIAVMIGATFGGLAGFGTAVALDHRAARRAATVSNRG